MTMLPHLTSVAPRSLAVVSPLYAWWTFNARHSGAPGRGVIDRRPPTASRGPAIRWHVRSLTRPASYETSSSYSLSVTGSRHSRPVLLSSSTPE
ncbi:hypothetical protein K438DRAFT_1828528, partial [Mycena galopus ATCC 62051]